MSNYIRVIPRDLFNEANLLKCLGQIYIQLERTLGHSAAYAVESVDQFDIRQNQDDGSIRAVNLPFAIAGHEYHLSRPLNSRQSWPLWLSDPDNNDFEPIQVFDDSGAFSADMLSLLKTERSQHD